MSDLQCAATMVLVRDGGDFTALRAVRPAAVHAGPTADDGAATLAGALDVPLRRLPERASRPADLVAALDELADEYRGECIAVVVAPSTFTALTALVLPGTDTPAVVVEINADGQRWEPAVSDSRGR